MRKGRWAYHHYVGFEPELFDLASDPLQAQNLAGLAAHREMRVHMEALLRGWLDPEVVDRQAKQDQNRLVERMGGREVALRMGPQGASPAPAC